MIRTVVKKDGSKEPFSTEKIALSVTRAGAPGAVARRIAEDIKVSPDLKEETTSADVRAAVLVRLQRIDLVWDLAWRKYEYEVKKRPTRGKP
jgi:transcriptional regulator NrdR family protein